MKKRRKKKMNLILRIVVFIFYINIYIFYILYSDLEKEMAAHSNILAWRIPRTEEPGELQSMGSYRVGHN